jgi:hypothetical protein
MKHASAETLHALDPLLGAVRNFSELRERTPGAFYRRGKAFLHFHEDAAGVFADIKLVGSNFTRVLVSTSEQQTGLLALITDALRTKSQSPR